MCSGAADPAQPCQCAAAAPRHGHTMLPWRGDIQSLVADPCELRAGDVMLQRDELAPHANRWAAARASR